MAALRKVGLITHTGQISSHIYRNLLGPNNDRKIKLVVLHRPTSDTSAIPANVETRTLDLEQGSDDAVKTAVQDLNVIVCGISPMVAYLQSRIINALRGSSSLMSYIPAEIGSFFTEEELADPRITPVVGLAQRLREAEEAGIKDKITMIVSGEFVSAFWSYGVDIKANQIDIFNQAKTRKAPLATPRYLGAAIAQLVVKDPTTFAGKYIHMYDHEPTGQDLIDILTRLHGAPTRITPITDQDVEDRMNTGDPVRAMGACLFRHWGNGYLEQMGTMVQERGGWREVKDWELEPLEEVIKQSL